MKDFILIDLLFNEIIEALNELDKNKDFRINRFSKYFNSLHQRNKSIINTQKIYNTYNGSLKHDLQNNQYSVCKYLKVVKQVIKITCN